MIRDGLVEIGIPWGFNEWTDVDGYFSDMIYNNISVVDLIPVIPKLSAEALKETAGGKVSSLFRALYVPDPEKGCEYYNNLLSRFGSNLTFGCDHVKGIRLYITDASQLSEVVTNQYSESATKGLISSAASKIPVIGNILTAARDYTRKVTSMLYEAPDFLERLLKAKESEIPNLIGSIMAGCRIDYPVVWSDTEYSRRTSINVVLSTPYGHPEAVWVWIVRPLIYLLLLGVPINWAGPIGFPLYVTVRAHGLFYFHLAAIESITIDRGGPNTVFNMYKQPLRVVLTISIRDLYSSLSVDPRTRMNAHEVITKPRTHGSKIPFYDNSMPTVDKLVESFAPEKPRMKGFRENMTMVKHKPAPVKLTANLEQTTQQLKEANTLNEQISLSEEINNVINEVYDTAVV